MRLGLLALALAACAVSYQHGRHVEHAAQVEVWRVASEAFEAERTALWVRLVNADPGSALEMCATDYECETAEQKLDALATTTTRTNRED